MSGQHFFLSAQECGLAQPLLLRTMGTARQTGMGPALREAS